MSLSNHSEKIARKERAGTEFEMEHFEPTCWPIILPAIVPIQGIQAREVGKCCNLWTPKWFQRSSHVCSHSQKYLSEEAYGGRRIYGLRPLKNLAIFTIPKKTMCPLRIPLASSGLRVPPLIRYEKTAPFRQSLQKNPSSFDQEGLCKDLGLSGQSQDDHRDGSDAGRTYQSGEIRG